MKKKLIENEGFTTDLMESLLHWALEDNNRKTNHFGNALNIAVEFKDQVGSTFLLEGLVSNQHYLVTSVRLSTPDGEAKELMRSTDSEEE